MKRETKIGNEYKEMNIFLREKLIAHNKIYLELGTPSKNGEYRLSFSIGKLLLTQAQDTLAYEFEELNNMPINCIWKVSELKAKLADIIKEKKGVDVEIGKMRLRERNSDKFGQILHNESKLKDYALYDKKAVVIEILEEEQITKSEDLLLLVKLWDAKKFELGCVKEVFVKKRDRLKELSFVLETLFGIPSAEIQGYKVNNLWSFNRGDLLNEDWIDLHESESLVVGDPWFASRDGAFVM